MSCVGAEVVITSRKFVGTDHEEEEQYTGTVAEHRFVEPDRGVLYRMLHGRLEGKGPTDEGYDRIKVIIGPGLYFDTSLEGVQRVDGQPLVSLGQEQGQRRG